MQPINTDRRAAWNVERLQRDRGWIFVLDDRARRDLARAVKTTRDPEKTLFDYRRAEFNLASALPIIESAMREAMQGTGIAIVRGLPRSDLTAIEFELLTWAIGLHCGVARPQGKTSSYLSAVRDAGTIYRTGRGRGYSSSAELDFHTDSADIVLLACFNAAKSGGMSMVTSSVAAHNFIALEHPEIAELLHQPYFFSRQEEQAPHEAPFYPNPIFDTADGSLCSKWNRNRVRSAQAIEGVPLLTSVQAVALDTLDAVLRHPSLMHTMYLEPGDLQILNSHVTLHSRTAFVDHDSPELKRTLYRLWLAPRDSPRLPDSWLPAYGWVEANTVRGGIIGQAYDETRRSFERRQASDIGMRVV